MFGVHFYIADPIFVYKAKLTNTKFRKCFRYTVYKLAEQHQAHLRYGMGDGIKYSNDEKQDLEIQLVFKAETNSLSFQTEIRNMPFGRKRSMKMSELDVHVEDDVLTMRPLNVIPLKRVYSTDYDVISDDPNRSEDCNDDFSLSSYSSIYTAVDMDDMIKLRLLDAEDSVLLGRNKVERCHLKSQAHFKELKDNPNNIIYATRHLHEHFDGINKPDGVPSFVLKYVSHETVPQTVVCNGSSIVVYETTVSVEFLDEELKSILARFFKNGYTVIGVKEIQFTLHFQNPNEFKTFAEFKETESRDKWLSLLGVDD